MPDDKNLLPPPPPPPMKAPAPPQTKKRKTMMGRLVYRALTNIDAGNAYYKVGSVIPDPKELDTRENGLKEGVHYAKDVEHVEEDEV